MANELFGSDDNLEQELPETGLYETLVGEGKKYKDPDALAKAKLHQDLHIRRVEEEAAELRRQLNSVARLEEIATRLSSKTPTTEAPQVPREENPNNGTVVTSEDVEKILSRRELVNKQNSNLQMVKDTFERSFGSTWQTVIKQKAKSLALSEEDVLDLAKTRPLGLLKMFEVDKQPEPNSGVPASRINTAGLKDDKGAVMNWKYFEKVRKENPSEYNSMQFQKKLLSAVAQADDSFYK